MYILFYIESNLTKKQGITYGLPLLVLASVQHSPVDLSGVPLGQESRLALGVQKLEHLMKTGSSS